MFSPTISVIIPAYNLESHIQACLDSLAEPEVQSRLEVIVIDDASTDGTLARVEAYDRIAHLLILSGRANAGPGEARNRGIEASHGDYVLFLDGDDQLAEGAIQRLIQVIDESSPDTVTYDWCYGQDSGSELASRNQYFGTVPERPQQVAENYLAGNMDGSVIYTLTKAALLKGSQFRFPPGYHEDIFAIFQIYYCSSARIELQETLYIKNNREGSIVNSLTGKHLRGYLSAWVDIINYLLDREGPEARSRYRSAYHRGINGLVAGLVQRIASLASLERRSELYVCLFELLVSDPFLDLDSMEAFPDISKKDKIARFFYATLGQTKTAVSVRITALEDGLNKRTLGCADIHHSLYAAPDMLRHCCQRFFVDGQIKGDVKLFDITDDDDVSVARILESKRQLWRQVNETADNPCSGCPSLKYEEWPSLEALQVRHLSVEPHSVCNFKCSYCSDTYYGGKKPTYDILSLYHKIQQQGGFSSSISMVWGGGEPVLLKGFENVLMTLTNGLKPHYNNIFTNATVYSDNIASLLAQNKASITTSIDAGSSGTFYIVRGKEWLHRVLENLRKYAVQGADNITIKYILLAENLGSDEVLGFVRLVDEYGLSNCGFQISTDYKNERIQNDVIDAAMLMHKGLKEIGADFVNFDEHIRGRISERVSADAYNRQQYENIIIWGASEYAHTLLRKSTFFKRNSISCFVDSNPERLGKQFNGYPIKHPDTVLETQAPIFIASATFYREIYKQMMAMGVSRDRIIEHILV